MSKAKTMTNASSSQFQVPLTRLAHQEAQQFYYEHKNPQKAKQVYLNCLAVYAVEYYLKCLGIQTNKQQSDSFQLIPQTLSNIADLELEEGKKIECRPVLPNQNTCLIPAETWEDRLGYVAVQLNKALTQATLIGFLETVNCQEDEEVLLSKFEPMNKLIEKVTSLENSTSPTREKPAIFQLTPSSPIMQITQWLQEETQQEWQKLKTLINPQLLEVAVRSGQNLSMLNEAKWVELGKPIQLTALSEPLILGIAFQTMEQSELNISVELYPNLNEKYLPTGLEMQILDENQQLAMQAMTKENNPYLRFSLLAELGDRFSAKITFKEVSFVQEFMV